MAPDAGSTRLQGFVRIADLTFFVWLLLKLSESLILTLTSNASFWIQDRGRENERAETIDIERIRVCTEEGPPNSIFWPGVQRGSSRGWSSDPCHTSWSSLRQIFTRCSRARAITLGAYIYCIADKLSWLHAQVRKHEFN